MTITTCESTSLGFEMDVAVRLTAVRTWRPGDGVPIVFGWLRCAGLAPAPIAYALRSGSIWTATPRPGDVVEVTLRFSPRWTSSERDGWIEAWRCCLPPNRSGFDVLKISPARELVHERARFIDGDIGDEVALRFVTPLRRPRRQDVRALADMASKRLSQWFGVPMPAALPSLAELEFAMRPAHPTGQPVAASNSDWGDRFAGRRGILFLRGELQPWAPWLPLLARIGLCADGTDINGMGQFEVVAPPPALVDAALIDEAALERTADAVVRDNDFGPERWPLDDVDGEPLTVTGIAHNIAPSLRAGTWAFTPPQRFAIARADGRSREVVRHAPLDMIVLRHALEVLRPAAESSMQPTAHGWRPGRSRDSALEAVREAISEGYIHIARGDVENCFSSIPHGEVVNAVDRVLPRSDTATRRLIGSWLEASSSDGVGVPQGSPLSSLVANLVLSDADEALAGGTVRSVRFGDDVVVLARTARELAGGWAVFEQRVQSVGLALNVAKTRFVPPGEPFEYLGQRIDPAVDAEPPLELVLAQRKPFIVVEPYVWLGTAGDTVQVHKGPELVQAVPLRRVSELIVLTRATVSTALLARCARLGIPVCLASEGRLQGLFMAAADAESHRIAVRQAQQYDALDEAGRLSVAMRVVVAKISNHHAWIRGNWSAGDDVRLGHLDACLLGAQRSMMLDELRGHEANAARAAFDHIHARIRDDQRADFASPVRDRKRDDPFNVAYNFASNLVGLRIGALLRAAGLDPHLGYLHTDTGYDALTWDIADVFRVHTERALLNAINNRRIRGEHFSPRAGRLRLSGVGTAGLTESLEQIWSSVVDGIVLRDLLVMQVRALRRYACEGGALWLHRWVGTAGRRPGERPGRRPLPARRGAES